MTTSHPDYAKLAARMADYGYTCLRLSDDYNGADLIALREGEEAIHIQLKGRVTIKQPERKELKDGTNNLPD